MPTTKTLKRRNPRRVTIDPRVAVKRWIHADDAAKQFTADKEETRKILLGILMDDGTEDENGHYWINWPDDPVEGRVKGIKAEKHVTRTLNKEAAEEYLKGRKLHSQCVETIMVLSEDKILGLNFDGKISDEDLETLYEVTTNYHFVPQRIKL